VVVYLNAGGEGSSVDVEVRSHAMDFQGESFRCTTCEGVSSGRFVVKTPTESRSDSPT
jgi:hypothetical protein